MQFSRYLTYSKSDSAYRFIPWIAKGLLVVASLYYVVTKLFAESGAFSEIVLYFKEASFIGILLAVTMLMLVNWWLETRKWQIVARPYKRVSLTEAFKAVVSGISLDSVLPLGTGAVAGKVMSIGNSKRNNLIFPVMLAQGLQSFWTVVFGFMGLYQLSEMTSLGSLYGFDSQKLMVGGLLLLSAILIVLIWPRITHRLLEATRQYPIKVWIVLTGLSLLRYFVFLIQLLLLSRFLSPEIPLEILIGCSTWVFFAKTIVPKPGHIGALGIRGASAIFFLSLAGYAYSGFVIATLLLWIVNLALPSLIGLFFIKELHFSTVSE